MKSERGIILNPKILNNIPIPFYLGNIRNVQIGSIYNNEKSNSIELIIKDEQIKNYMFYWDKVAVPKVFHNNEYAIAPMFESETIKTLLSEKKLIQDVSFNVTTTPENSQGTVELTKIFADAQHLLYNELNKKTNDRWNLGQSGDELIASQATDNTNKELLEIMLYNCLPMPNPKTHIDDILNFKNKRSDELYNLRITIDELKKAIQDSSNRAEEFKKAIEKIEHKIVDINKVMSESKIDKIYKSLNLFLTVNERTIIPTLSVLGRTIAASSGLSIPLVFLTAYAIQGGLSIITHEKNIKLPKDYDDFIYLYEATRKKIITP